jgi:NDP-mannose synthase
MEKRAIILAGGRGTRLGPYTTVLPKPLLPIGERAILEVVARQLRDFGFTRVTIAVGYLGHLVQAVMRDGSHYGLTIDYQEEEEPLGTVGPLATIEGLDDSFLVMNGDVLTSLDYGQLLEIHRESGNVLTIASHRRVVRTEYGVLHVDPGSGGTQPIVGYEEKPELPFLVSMGVYAMAPRALDFIDAGVHLDLPDLVMKLIDAGEPVGSYMFEGYWLDIGRHEDYEKAIMEYESLRTELHSPDQELA